MSEEGLRILKTEFLKSLGGECWLPRKVLEIIFKK